jgi:ABC-2 type transport system permease protein
MDNPFLYLTLSTMRNQLRVRLRRLRQPRYAIALLLGIGYFTLVFGRPFLFGGRSRDPGIDGITAEARAIAQTVGGGALFMLLALPWIFPSKQRAALAVTQPEVQFLFTAPLSRRRLIRYKLLRSLVGALFSSAFLTIVMRPDSLAQAVIRFVGTMLIIALLNLHYTGIGLHRLPASEERTGALLRRWLPPGIALALMAIVAGDLLTRWPAADAIASGASVSEIARLASSGLTGVVLWPFRAIVALPLADSAMAFLVALPWPLLAIALNYLWVVSTDVPFEEASAELADKIARVRKEGVKALRKPRAAGATPFALAPDGLIETAILWKNMISMRRSLSWLTLLPFMPLLIAMGTAMLVTTDGSASRADALTVVSMVIAGLTVAIGPLMLRTDLRQDLPNLAILRTWPVRGGTLVRGQVLAPALVLSTIVWMALAAVAIFSMFGSGEMDIARRWSYFVAAVIVAPGVILVQLLIQNGLAVTFPSWVSTGPARGVDAIGQRMLLTLVGMLGLVIGILPAALVGGGLALAVRFATGGIAIVAPALVAAAVLFGEAALVSELVGSVLDRTDVSALDPADT